MFKGLNGLNPGNLAFKQFKCPVLNVLRGPPLANNLQLLRQNIHSYDATPPTPSKQHTHTS